MRGFPLPFCPFFGIYPRCSLVKTVRVCYNIFIYFTLEIYCKHTAQRRKEERHHGTERVV